jgi:hypothetical protein
MSVTIVTSVTDSPKSSSSSTPRSGPQGATEGISRCSSLRRNRRPFMSWLYAGHKLCRFAKKGENNEHAESDKSSTTTMPAVHSRPADTSRFMAAERFPWQSDLTGPYILTKMTDAHFIEPMPCLAVKKLPEGEAWEYELPPIVQPPAEFFS